MQRNAMLAQTRPNLALYAALLLIAAFAVAGPVAQPDHYHHFADQRILFGIPNALDVLSNLGFLLAAVYGAFSWRRARTPAGGDLTVNRAVDRIIFVAAIGLTAIGSAWYHLAPDNARLVWDRLPIALACAALLSGAMRQAYPSRAALPLLLAGAVASVLWWRATGDLRPYLLLQLAPLILIPLMQWQCGAPIAQRKAFALAIALYVLAKAAEVGDVHVFATLDQVSGHSLKHVFASVAALILVSNRSWKETAA
jgi:hypothetical protein